MRNLGKTDQQLKLFITSKMIIESLIYTWTFALVAVFVVVFVVLLCLLFIRPTSCQWTLIEKQESCDGFIGEKFGYILIVIFNVEVVVRAGGRYGWLSLSW